MVGPQNLKVSPVSTCSLKNLGHKLSNKVLGSPLASILSDRRPLEIFLGPDTENCQKFIFFAFGQISWDCDICSHIQGTTMWNGMLGVYGVWEFLYWSYCCWKSEDSEILGMLAKIRGVTKNNTLAIMSFGFQNENSLKTTLLATLSLSFRHQIPKSKCCFFVTPDFVVEIWLEFDS